MWTIGQVVLLAVAIPVLAGVAGISELSALALGRSIARPVAGLATLAALGGGVLTIVGFAALANRNDQSSSAPALSALMMLGGLLLAGALGITLLGLLSASRTKGSTNAAHLLPFSEETN